MSDIAIKVENLGKSYLIGHNTARGERYTALRDVITHNAKNLARKTRDMLQGKAIVQGDEVEEFWALKEINFEIKQGDRVGIIGRNGAGKSTLLKILSRITEPTTGRITINGRVASLLEVGTGFHPELTGRENIFLNGAILGMSRSEIQRKFDEIVDFAEVERFLDTPVKRYSSGMYVRLAFAVAAHLDPELMVVDEVLAVGDAKFQKKCLGKMEDVSRKEGRTVLFVSHNMAVIQSLCPQSIVLNDGEIRFAGSSTKAVQQYLATTATVAQFKRPVLEGKTTITGGSIFVDGESLIMNVRISSGRPSICSLEVTLHDSFGSPIGFASAGLLNTDGQINLNQGNNDFTCRVKVSSLALGQYFISIQLGIPWVDIIDRADRVMRFDIDRPACDGMQHALRQDWGYGCFELPMMVSKAIADKST